MMQPTIHWRLLFRVKDRDKAHRRVEEVRRVLAREIEATRIERYWKDEAFWDCNLNTPGVAGHAAEVAFDCLMLANRLGNGWYLLGPGGQGELVVFEGVFDVRTSGRPYVPGLEWASFSLDSGSTHA
ncbi:hypothetical protein OJF2_73620 [Aquisphaera giovannonii]|uniref:Uncharacterized protein n=1 Tax=Aquisphaera giovannonii TaxID=406548 RepID=A0A5B9WDQ2_9BACT|nr:hypothetical protein [Aquisphaera giovannonii]QEH38756.1 hypothetical protein OJF2_73620 [Aquisphaera giovannonii]